MKMIVRNLGLAVLALGAGAVLAFSGCGGGSSSTPDASYYNPPDSPPIGQPDAAPADAPRLHLPDGPPGGSDAAPSTDAAGSDAGSLDAAPSTDAGGGSDANNTCSPACTAPEVCQPSGQCAAPLSAIDLTKHPLLISELQPAPQLSTTNTDGEYVEIVNVTHNAILLDGLEIHDTSATVTTVVPGIILASGATAVFVHNTTSSQNGGITATGKLLNGLNNSGDTISIEFNAGSGTPTVIHQVKYPGGTVNNLGNTGSADGANGDSIQLDQKYIDAVRGGTAGLPKWCETPQVAANGYANDGSGTTDYGTPNATNVDCP